MSDLAGDAGLLQVSSAGRSSSDLRASRLSPVSERSDGSTPSPAAETLQSSGRSSRQQDKPSSQVASTPQQKEDSTAQQVQSLINDTNVSTKDQEVVQENKVESKNKELKDVKSPEPQKDSVGGKSSTSRSKSVEQSRINSGEDRKDGATSVSDRITPSGRKSNDLEIATGAQTAHAPAATAPTLAGQEKSVDSIHDHTNAANGGEEPVRGVSSNRESKRGQVLQFSPPTNGCQRRRAKQKPTGKPLRRQHSETVISQRIDKNTDSTDKNRNNQKRPVTTTITTAGSGQKLEMTRRRYCAEEGAETDSGQRSGRTPFRPLRHGSEAGHPHGHHQGSRIPRGGRAPRSSSHPVQGRRDSAGGQNVNRSCSLAHVYRQSTANMVDLHVYLIPRDKWSELRHLADRSSLTETISLGFIRVDPDTNLYSLREEIHQQLLGDCLSLEDYRFVKSVGKHFTEVKLSQECRLKASNFMPPHTCDPELHLLRCSVHERFPPTAVIRGKDADRSCLRKLEQKQRRHQDYFHTKAAIQDLRERYERVKMLREKRSKEKDKLVAISKRLQDDIIRHKEEESAKYRKMFEEEQGMADSLQDICSTLRRDIEHHHDRLILRIRTRGRTSCKEGPSRKLTLKMNIHRLEEDIDDWERRRQTSQMTLDTEIMLRCQAERNVKELRKELSQKNLSVTDLKCQYGKEVSSLLYLLGRNGTSKNQC